MLFCSSDKWIFICGIEQKLRPYLTDTSFRAAPSNAAVSGQCVFCLLRKTGTFWDTLRNNRVSWLRIPVSRNPRPWLESASHLLSHSIVIRSWSGKLTSLSPIFLIGNIRSIIISPQRVTVRIRRDNPCENTRCSRGHTVRTQKMVADIYH